jgi:long-chain fatty acid transport protein
MKHLRTVLLAFLLVFGASSLGWTNGFNLNSIGSRALSMGGAFVGLADDYSAIFWNPAGLAQFKRRAIGFYGSDIIPKGSYLFQRPTDEGLLTVVDAKTKTKHYLSGMLAYYQPVNESLVAGIGLYVPAGLGAAWNGDDFRFLTNNISYLWESRIGMITLSPAIAYKVNDMVSVGAALNLNYGTFSVKTHAGNVEIPVPPGQLDLGQYDESLNGWGIGVTFGVLVKPSETLSFGATIRTPSKVKLNGDVSIENLDLLGPNFKNSSDVSRDVTWPWWIAAGVAYRPMQDLTLTFDLQWTQWSKEQELETRFKDPYWSLLMQESGDNILSLKWEDALQVRFGAEYVLYQNVAIRAGYYYDPSPAPEKTTNVLIPSYDFNAFTLGVGYDLSGLVIDFGFEMLFGKTREVDFAKWLLDPAWESSMPGVYKMNLFVPTISVSYKF